MKIKLIILLLIITGCNNTELWDPEICEIRQTLIEHYENGELISSVIPDDPIIYDVKDYPEVELVQISEGISETEWVISTYKKICY